MPSAILQGTADEWCAIKCYWIRGHSNDHMQIMLGLLNSHKNGLCTLVSHPWAAFSPQQILSSLSWSCFSATEKYILPLLCWNIGVLVLSMAYVCWALFFCVWNKLAVLITLKAHVSDSVRSFVNNLHTVNSAGCDRCHAAFMRALCRAVWTCGPSQGFTYTRAFWDIGTLKETSLWVPALWWYFHINCTH